jgi:hypothetical protein
MAGIVYALLVGINDYPTPINPLRGCVNDVKRMLAFLQQRTQHSEFTFAPLILTSGDHDNTEEITPTRQAVIDGFRTHLSKASNNDVAIFYYSGHGSQAPSPPEFWHLEPDRLDETLVCYDSRTAGGWDLADKELAQLIAEVTANGPHVVVILDCCHSGSGTRASAEEEMCVRRVPTDARLRPLETLLVTPAQAEVFGDTGRSVKGGGWYSLPKGRHTVLAACSPEEEAKELFLEGEQRGAFSYYLLDTLQRASANLTYRDLFKRVNAQVRARVAAQSPQMEATNTPDLDQPFLGGAIAAGPSYFTLSHDKQRGWVIDGGAVHGIPGPTGAETTLLALFPFDAHADQLTSLATAIGEARVQQVFPAQSAVDVTLTSGAVPDPDTTYKAVVTALPLPPLVVTFEGDPVGLALVRTALATASPHGDASSLVCEGDREAAELLLQAVANCYRIRRKGDGYTLVVDMPGWNPGSAQLVIQRLECIARWRKIVELANPTSRIAATDIRLDILCPTKEGQWLPVAASAHAHLEYTFRNNAWQQPQFKIKLTNTSPRRLYCILLDLPETYGVFSMLPGGGVWLAPGQEAWANNGEPMYGQVLDNLWQQGVIEFQDTLKLIVSTDESDATLLVQDDLPVTVLRAVNKSTRMIAHMHTLNRLMHRVQTRHFSAQPAGAESLADWTTAEVSFTTLRPLAAADISRPGHMIPVGHGVTVVGHARLQAQARLTSLPQMGREAGNLALPALLRDHSEVIQPLEFSISRNGEPGLSVLELVDVVDHTVVAEDNPLVVQIDNVLGADEYLLPLGYDGELYLPLGRTERTANSMQVVLERLPAPTSSGQRDLKGSIKILFQKLVGRA